MVPSVSDTPFVKKGNWRSPTSTNDHNNDDNANTNTNNSVFDLYQGALGDFPIEQLRQQLALQQLHTNYSSAINSSTVDNGIQSLPTLSLSYSPKIFDNSDVGSNNNKMNIDDDDDVEDSSDCKEEQRMEKIFNIIDDVLTIVDIEDFDTLFLEANSQYWTNKGTKTQ